MVGAHADEWLSLAVLLSAIFCTLVANRWWRRTRLAMLYPRFWKAIRRLEIAEKKERDNAARLSALRDSVAEEAAFAAHHTSVVAKCVAIIMYLCVRFALLGALIGFFSPQTKEVVVSPEYFLQGYPQRVLQGSSAAELGQSLAAFVVHGTVPNGSDDPFAYQRVYGRAVGVGVWGVLCHIFASVVLA